MEAARPTIVAATSAIGRQLVARLAARNIRPIAVGRDTAKLGALAAIAETRCADLTDPSSLGAALADATRVVVCANAVHLPAVLAALPPDRVERLVAMGSTRTFSKAQDATGDAVRRAQTLLAAAPFETLLLLSSMIYGTGKSVLDSMLATARRLPVLPVPARRVQPIHAADVARALEAAISRAGACGAPIVIAGPVALPYPQVARRLLAAHGLRRPVLPVPAGLIALAGRLSGRADMMRLAEDAAFDITEMRRRLGIEPREFTPVDPE